MKAHCRHGRGAVKEGGLELELAEVLKEIGRGKGPSPKTPLLKRPVARKPVVLSGKCRKAS